MPDQVKPLSEKECAEDITVRLRKACVGHPDAKIPWPHRLLHDAMATIASLRRELEEAQRLLGEVVPFTPDEVKAFFGKELSGVRADRDRYQQEAARLGAALEEAKKEPVVYGPKEYKEGHRDGRGYVLSFFSNSTALDDYRKGIVEECIAKLESLRYSSEPGKDLWGAQKIFNLHLDAMVAAIRALDKKEG